MGSFGYPIGQKLGQTVYSFVLRVDFDLSHIPAVSQHVTDSAGNPRLVPLLRRGDLAGL